MITRFRIEAVGMTKEDVQEEIADSASAFMGILRRDGWVEWECTDEFVGHAADRVGIYGRAVFRIREHNGEQLEISLHD